MSSSYDVEQILISRKILILGPMFVRLFLVLITTTTSQNIKFFLNVDGESIYEYIDESEDKIEKPGMFLLLDFSGDDANINTGIKIK